MARLSLLYSSSVGHHIFQVLFLCVSTLFYYFSNEKIFSPPCSSQWLISDNLMSVSWSTALFQPEKLLQLQDELT